MRPGLLRRAYESIEAAAGDVSFEVVIVADFGPEEWPHCRWIVRERHGVVDAVNRACEEARGEYWFLFNDESRLDPGALELLYHEAVSTPDQIVTPVHIPTFPFFYYGFEFAPFPFAHRDLVASLGGLLDPVYRGFYADPDFSLRAHVSGVKIRTIEDAILRHGNNHDEPHWQSVASYLDADRATFRARWDHLGVFIDP